MATLVTNVHVDGHGWFGPAHGNADQVPDEAAALIASPGVWAEAGDNGTGGDGTGDLELLNLLGPSLRPEPEP